LFARPRRGIAELRAIGASRRRVYRRFRLPHRRSQPKNPHNLAMPFWSSAFAGAAVGRVAYQAADPGRETLPASASNIA
jgi:hypothetical protein